MELLLERPASTAREPLRAPELRKECCVACNAPIAGQPHFAHRTIRLFSCAGCGSLTALPRPSSATQIALHDSAEYFSHPYFEQRRSSVLSLERRCRTTFEKIACAVDPVALRGDRHLDIGCDTGAFLTTAARLYGTVPVGVDVAQRPVAEAVRQGLEAYCGVLEAAPESVSGLGLVTAVDLIEHVVDPVGFMAEVRRRLRPGGVCYFETPNIASAVYRLGRALAKASGGRPDWLFERLFPREHIQYFTGDGLRGLAKAAGLETVDISARSLPFADIATSLPVRVAMSCVQTADVAGHSRILLCLTARRPQ